MDMIKNIAIVVLIIVSLCELLYIFILRRSVEKIAESFSEKIHTDTNTRIFVSIGDKKVRKLASKINAELVELRKDRLKLKQGDLELKIAVTNVAHDLRTPLTAINGYLELMEELEEKLKLNGNSGLEREEGEFKNFETEENGKEKIDGAGRNGECSGAIEERSLEKSNYKIDEVLRSERDRIDVKRQKYLATIRERTNNLIYLTNELFKYSVVSATDEELNPEELSLNSELEVAIAGAYSILTENGITPEISITEALVIKKLDKNALQRIFANILTNAAKYSEGDLSITLTDDGTVTFKNKAEKLSSVEAAKLFDRFYTVENAKGSTGLGLSIARLLTEKMGGSISASWAEGDLYINLRF